MRVHFEEPSHAYHVIDNGSDADEETVITQFMDIPEIAAEIGYNSSHPTTTYTQRSS